MAIMAVLTTIPATEVAAQRPWTREVYREIDLRDHANMGLYSPARKQQGKEGLFEAIINLPIKEGTTIYAYAIGGNELLSEEGKVRITDVLDAYAIPYQTDSVSGQLLIKETDIPKEEVIRYYIRERHYYDAVTSEFKKEVVALCPVLERGDGLSGAATRYPMFWIRYQDARKALSDIKVVTDYHNTAAVISAADYFDLSLYKGDIYMERNAMGNALAYDTPTDSAMVAERQRVERELKTVKDVTYDTFHGQPMETRQQTHYRRFLFLRFKDKDTSMRETDNK